MRNDKHLAIKLREAGKSYKQIGQELGIARSTLSDWLSPLKWSRVITDDLTRKANYINHTRFRKVVRARTAMWEQWRENARMEAKKEFSNLIKDPLFIAGIMLYWGEGDSKLENGHVKLSNTSADMMRLFTKFLQVICKVASTKLKGEMILYPDLKQALCQKFWCDATGIPTQQFYKTQYIKGKHPTKRLSHGIFMVQVGDRRLKEKIAVWINLFQQQYSEVL